MRKRLLDFLKMHNIILQFVYLVGHCGLKLFGVFLPIRKKRMIFASYGGRKYDDSPKAIYEAICKDSYFDDWDLVWAFINPEQEEVIRGKKIKIDTLQFFKYLLTSKVWVSNSGLDRNLGICKKETIMIETWHGTPIKKIGAEQNEGHSVVNHWIRKYKKAIRCAQSQYDLKIFERVMKAEEDEFVVCDLPRNDELVGLRIGEAEAIKEKLNIPKNKKVILYMPTYREYLVTENNACYIAPPITLTRWQKELGEKYVLLFRAHYAISDILGLKENEFVRNVSNYPLINELYIISDILISDYSSAFVDFSILERPMLCFAYDLDEYKKMRGLYMDIEKELPCPVDRNEESILKRISTLDYKLYSKQAEDFKKKYAPNAGKATQKVIEKLKECLEKYNS